MKADRRTAPAGAIAILLDEMKLADQGWSIDLIGTDLSSDQVARAEEGIFSAYEIERGVTSDKLGHFHRHGSSFHVQDRLRRMVSFRVFNLLDSFGWLHQLDVVFCRNVLMFLDEQTKREIVAKIADVLAPGGALIVGKTELLDKITEDFSLLPGATGIFELDASRNESGRRRLSLVGS